MCTDATTTTPCPLQGKGRKRGFDIIRKPELEGTSFLYNNVEVKYVGTCPETGISLYCSILHNYGVRVFPNGSKTLINAIGSTSEGCRNVWDARRKQRYLHFAHAFGNHKQILVSHAVWMAAGRVIPPGMTMDHINGCTTDNRLGNLRCISNAENNRDGGFLRKLRHKGIDPVKIQRPYLLRYFDRMAEVKATISRWRYTHLTRSDLLTILYAPSLKW